MNIVTPEIEDKYVQKILNMIDSEFEPEKVPVIVEPYAKVQNCYINVDEKIKKDGGKVHYGWSIYKTDILCEAERHAVWENEDEELIDITPKEIELDEILFVSDNDFIYTGQLVDNIRVNITNNPVVEDFIMLCENLEIFYTYGKRIDDSRVELPEQVTPKIILYENLKGELLSFIYSGGEPRSKCFCGGVKNYKNCHGATLKKDITEDVKKIKKKLRI